MIHAMHALRVQYLGFIFILHNKMSYYTESVSQNVIQLKLFWDSWMEHFENYAF